MKKVDNQSWKGKPNPKIKTVDCVNKTKSSIKLFVNNCFHFEIYSFRGESSQHMPFGPFMCIFTSLSFLYISGSCFQLKRK